MSAPSDSTSDIPAPHGWPDNFDFRTDADCQNIFKPWILGKLKELQAYDEQRRLKKPNITYIFREHTLRVADNVQRCCEKELQLGEMIATNIRWAVLLHDIGKIQIPAESWDSEEKPTDAVKKLRRTHTLLGAQTIQEELSSHTDHPFVQLMIDLAAYHHEHMDGSGEHGVQAEQLTPAVRLVAIIEAYDGYRIPRPHFGERIITPEAVLKKMREEKGDKIYDLMLFEIFSAMKMRDWNNDYIRENRSPETYAYVLE